MKVTDVRLTIKNVLLSLTALHAKFKGAIFKGFNLVSYHLYQTKTLADDWAETGT
jgi:hypothetical protein